MASKGLGLPSFGVANAAAKNTGTGNTRSRQGEGTSSIEHKRPVCSRAGGGLLYFGLYGARRQIHGDRVDAPERIRLPASQTGAARNTMICKVCKCEEATEFNGPTGLPIKRGLCRHCYECSICNTSDPPPKPTGYGIRTRDLSRRGTEHIGRRAMSKEQLERIAEAEVLQDLD